MPIDQAKLAKLQKMSANNKVGGTRRKQVHRSSNSNQDDTKLQAEMAKLKAVTLDNIAEANFFKDDGNVLHFNRAGVQTAASANTSVVYGIPQEKPLQSMFPQILQQLGPEAIQAMTQLSEAFKMADAEKLKKEAAGETENDDIPELVEGKTFDQDVE